MSLIDPRLERSVNVLSSLPGISPDRHRTFDLAMKTLLIPILLSLAAVLRFGSLWVASNHEVSPELIQAQDAARHAALSQPHDVPSGIQLQPLSFDAAALVVVTNGEDDRPGRAEVDDDFNGTVDDASERGAFGSDDVCEVLASGQASVNALDSNVTLLSRGGYVAAPTTAHSIADDPPRRYIVSGGNDADRWTFALDP